MNTNQMTMESNRVERARELMQEIYMESQNESNE